MNRSRLLSRLAQSGSSASVIAAVLWAGAPTYAHGQTAAAPSAAPQAKTNAPANQLQEIIVTAQRSEQSLQRVPVTVTPVSGDQLKALKLNSIYQLTVAVPSLAVGQSNYFAIRGVGTLALSSLLDQSVGVALDDVSLGVPGFMSYGLIDDVSQIEVLSGPQGLLFGRNASAGLINVMSNKPVFGKFGGDAYAEFDDRDSLSQGSYGGVFRGTLNLPTSDTSALRINFSEFYQDPIVQRVGPTYGKNYDHDGRTGVRVKYLWKPTSRFSAYLIGDYSDQQLLPYQMSYRNYGSPTSAGAMAAASEGIVAGKDNFKYGADGGDFRYVRTGGASLHLDYEISPTLTLSDIAAWRAFSDHESFDFDYTAVNLGNTFANRTSYNQYSNELRLAFKPSPLIDGQTGFYTFIQRQYGRQQVLASFGSGIPNLAGSDDRFVRDGQSYAGFGQVNVHPTDKLTLIVGARFTSDDVSLDALQNTGTYRSTLFGPKATQTRVSTDKTNISYRVGGQYQFTPAIMGYVTYSTGYKAPSYNQNVLAGPTPGTDTNPLVRDETVSSVEGGLKTTLFDRRLRLNVSGFYERFHNLQVQYLDPFGNFVIGNASSADTKGMELSAFARPLEGWSVNLGLTVQRAEFIDYAGAPCYPGQGCVTFNAAGLDLPNAARFTSTLQSSYERPVMPDTKAFIQGDFYHRSSINFLVDGEPRTKEGDVNQLGFSGGLRFDKGLELSLFCRNCTDERIPEAIYNDTLESSSGLKSNTQEWGYNSVRTIGISATYKF